MFFDVLETSEVFKTSEVSGKYAQEELFLAIKGLLVETVAFRKHFQIGDAKKLIEK